MITGVEQHAGWIKDFEAAARQRQADGDPPWAQRARLSRAVIASLQRFQLGESGDGANLLAKARADGDGSYLAAARLFVAEEQNHARLLGRLLGRLLAAAGAPVITRHWSDTVFVRLRRALGLRLELMVLFIAEFIALSYYAACRDGSDDLLTTEVAGRILADEQRHVRFHSQRLGAVLADLPAAARPVVCWCWQLLMTGTTLAVLYDHGKALGEYGLSRRAFARQAARGFRTAVATIRHDPPGDPPPRQMSSASSRYSAKPPI